MSGSSTFAQHALVQLSSPEESDSPETYEMSDTVLMHLFAQSRHIEARMTAKTTMSEVSAMVASRSLVGRFQIALGAAVMVEWCYMSELSVKGDMRLESYYGQLALAWDNTWEVCKKYYDAPDEVFNAKMSELPDFPDLADFV